MKFFLFKQYVVIVLLCVAIVALGYSFWVTSKTIRRHVAIFVTDNKTLLNYQRHQKDFADQIAALPKLADRIAGLEALRIVPSQRAATTKAIQAMLVQQGIVAGRVRQNADTEARYIVTAEGDGDVMQIAKFLEQVQFQQYQVKIINSTITATDPAKGATAPWHVRAVLEIMSVAS